jgi:hypothetical protein
MGVQRKGAVRDLAAVQQAQGAAGSQALIARMAGVMKRLAADVVARQKAGDQGRV